MKSAEIIAVGSELLTPSRLDTNSLKITERLNAVGIQVRLKTVVGDDRATVANLVEAALTRSDLVVLTGGLGPTDDDVTRDAVSEALALPLEEDPRIVERIQQRFEERGLRMPEINRRQAMVPRGASVLENVNGTAPGLWIDCGDKAVVLFPGPPREMQPMLDLVVHERLAPRSGGAGVYRRVLRIAGRTESHAEERAQPIYSRWLAGATPIETTILAAPGQIELHLSVRTTSENEARARLEAAVTELEAAFGADVFSSDGRSLEEVVGGLLRARAWRIAVAESCTGGLVLSRLTDVPGSSDYVERGLVAYSNRAKTELLRVPDDLIVADGAVSEPVALAMAKGAASTAGVAIGVGVTGIAGPGGGSDRKPVGTVVVAVVGPEMQRVRTFRFPGERRQVKFQASQLALDTVRRLLLEDASRDG
ncbi:MAG: competence/damage-inducible protein A [Acidobacteria bacterium]|nr:competence/damage-inducible protein A [Acidobacteriota bacterium]